MTGCLGCYRIEVAAESAVRGVPIRLDGPALSQSHQLLDTVLARVLGGYRARRICRQVCRCSAGAGVV
ncbi:MAG: hypothetical protein ACRDQ5_01365 [Sciscionella sp.]